MSNTAVTTTGTNPVAKFSKFMDGFKTQMALALPKHMTADRMARLALTQFSSSPKLQECDAHSIAGSIMIASSLGLEPGVNGQCFLVPYYDKRKRQSICQLVPGWKGLVDIANRSGRCTVWTGAVFEGDEFNYALGDRPFVHHKPGDEDRPDKLTHVYAVGRVTGSELPVIEVWTAGKVARHRDKYNKVGPSHYSFRDWEMYARKVPLLQVLKYMPASIELSNALTASNASDGGRNANVVIDGNFVHVTDPEENDRDEGTDAAGGQASAAGAPVGNQSGLPACTAEMFAKESAGWKQLITAKVKTVNDLIDTVETAHVLSDEQRMEIASWAVPKEPQQ